MAKNKRKMVCILDVENFEKCKQSILKFEKQRLVKLGGTSAHLTDSRALDVMLGTVAVLWGEGEDLYLASQRRNLEMVNTMVGDLLDEHTSDLVKSLAEWSGLKITYERQGSRVKFRFQEPDGASKELQIPLRRTEPPQNRVVN